MIPAAVILVLGLGFGLGLRYRTRRAGKVLNLLMLALVLFGWAMILMRHGGSGILNP